MEPIRITGDPVRVFDGHELAAARERVHGWQGPCRLCAAPFAELVLDAGGRPSLCSAAVAPLRRKAGADPTTAWNNDVARRVRDRMAAGELDPEHCAVCVQRLEAGLFDQVPLVRDHPPLAADAESPRAPRRLVVRLDVGPERPREAVLLQAFDQLASGLEELVIEVADPGRTAVFRELLARARAVRDTGRELAVTLRIGGAPRDPEARVRSLPLLADRVELIATAELERDLVWARTAVASRDGLVVRFEFGPTNWFDLHRAATVAAAFGVGLDPRAAGADGSIPLLDLPLGEQRLVQRSLSECWFLFDGSRRPRSLGPDAFERLRREVRRIVEHHAAARQWSDADALLRGGGTRLVLPPVDHPILVDPEIAPRCVGWIGALEPADGVVAWVDAAVADESFEARAAGRAWLRLLLQRAVAAGAAEPARALLRKLYRGGGRRRRLRDEERAVADRFGLRWGYDGWGEHLGLDRLGRRRPPFRVPAPPDRSAVETTDCTVLIPSFRHERYIADCVRSALAQTHPGLRVLVVDDGSPDATVERARRICDDRLEVRVNERNLGLGNSVLAALETIDTPYVALLNSDDLFHPERVASCVAALEADPDATLVATGLHLIDAAGGALTVDVANRLTDGDDVFDWVHWYESVRPAEARPDAAFAELLSGNFLATSTNLVARRDFLVAQADTLRSLKYCLDWQLFLTAARTGGLRYLPERLAAYRLHATNTVWFRDGRRWSYFLEVNRVAAAALHAFRDAEAERDGDDVARQRTFELVATRLAHNTEVAPAAVYACELLDGAALDRLVDSAEGLRSRVEALNRDAQRVMRAGYALRDVPDVELESRLGAIHMQAPLGVARVLAEIRSEQADTWRGEATRSRRVAARLESRVRQIAGLEEALRRDAARLSEVVAGAAAALESGVEPIRELASVPEEAGDEPVARLGRAVRLVHAVVEAAANSQRGLREQIAELTDERDAMRGARDHFEALHAAVVESSEVARDCVRVLEAQLERAQQGLVERDRLREQLRDRQAAVERQRNRADATRAELDQTRQRLRGRIDELRAELAAAHAEVGQLRRSREYRIGHFVWWKIPLFAKSRRLLRRTYHRTRESSLRTMMFLKRLLRGRSKQPLRIAAGSTATFPVISHTFVYQELTSMHTMLGADVRLLHTQKGPPEELHDAFRYLDEHRDYVQPAWDVHSGDLEYYRSTRPDRFASLLAALSEHSGIPEADIEQRFEFRMAFTYARRLEAWGADYVHTYFFYDQALAGLVSSWMLDIPRGLSTYADHMMQDFPLKVTKLHLQTAAVCVATSKRIRDELISIGGADIADKVIVKPNGVDGSRFRQVERSVARGRTFELVCVSRIEPKKGMVELAEAAALLKNAGRDVRIHVIGGVDRGCQGSEDYAARLEARIAELGVGEVLIRHGAMLQTAMREYLERADAFVAPFVETESGDKDGIPTAILEAIATGLPVLATDAGSIPEIIDDGVQGRIVPQRDPAALARVVEEWMDAPERILDMGKAAKQRFDLEFDVRATEPRLHERIRAAVKARRPVGAG